MNLICVFCVMLEVEESDAITVANGQAVCRRHLQYVPDRTESFHDAIGLARRNEPGSAARIRT